MTGHWLKTALNPQQMIQTNLWKQLRSIQGVFGTGRHYATIAILLLHILIFAASLLF